MRKSRYIILAIVFLLIFFFVGSGMLESVTYILLEGMGY